MVQKSLYEIVIVGAGPAGISLASEACQRGIDSNDILILEKAADHSWSIRKFYPDEKLVTANYKGIDVGCTGTLCLNDSSKDETLDYLSEAIEKFNLNILYNHGVEAIEKLRNGQYVVCSGNECFVTKTVAIAIGVLGRPNKPSYPIPSQVSPLVTYDVTSKKIMNKKVLVVGGGDSASEYVQYLSQQGNKVTLSYRKSEISRMNDINKKTLLDLANKGRCSLALGTDIEKLEPVDTDKEKVNVVFKSGEQETYEHIVYALGGTTPKNFLEAIGIEMKKEGPEVSNFFESKKEGVFLLGDLSAGSGGGSINLAFNNSHKAMQEICHMYLDCKK